MEEHIHRTIKLDIDIPIARKMLGIDFGYNKMNQASNDDILRTLISLLDCYGASLEEVID